MCFWVVGVRWGAAHLQEKHANCTQKGQESNQEPSCCEVTVITHTPLISPFYLILCYLLLLHILCIIYDIISYINLVELSALCWHATNSKQYECTGNWLHLKERQTVHALMEDYDPALKNTIRTSSEPDHVPFWGKKYPKSFFFLVGITLKKYFSF